MYLGLYPLTREVCARAGTKVEFRSHLNEFRNIAADLGHAVLSEDQEVWDLDEEAGLVWSHATMALSEHEARRGQTTSMVRRIETGMKDIGRLTGLRLAVMHTRAGLATRWLDRGVSCPRHGGEATF